MSEEIFNLIQDRKNLDTVSSDDLSEMGKLCQELVTLKHDVKQTELQFKARMLIKRMNILGAREQETLLRMKYHLVSVGDKTAKRNK